MVFPISSLTQAIHFHNDLKILGKVIKIQGLKLICSLPHCDITMGSMCYLGKIMGEVIGLDEASVTVMVSSPLDGIKIGQDVEFTKIPFSIAPDETWLGRVIGADGKAKDEKPHPLKGSIRMPLKGISLDFSKRARVKDPLDIGVKSLNTFTTLCKGQRLGIFAGSGVGKSVLLSMIARYSQADINVIGLIGERGREVKEFVEDTLGEEGLKRSIIIVETSDSPPLARKQAAYTTMAIAEYFRDQGKTVLCMIDSVTRFAMALREIGLSCGEPPTTKGYPPSVFSELPQLLERAGPGTTEGGGTITGIFSVLVDGDDHNEPIADAVRGILDGHIVMERKIAQSGLYPAVNVLKSISRLAYHAQNDDQRKIIQKARVILSTYTDMEDLIRLGAYQKGSNADVDRAITLYPAFFKFLSQAPTESISLEESFQRLNVILETEEQ